MLRTNVFTTIVIITIISTSIAIGQTEVDGEVSGVWDVEGSPYIATDDIIIPEDEELRIQPGVEVRFDGRFAFFVLGGILAEGNEEDSIVFTHNEDDPDSVWRGMRCYGSDEGSRIAFAVFEHGDPDSILDDQRGELGGGIYTDPLSHLQISNSSIRNCVAGGGCGILIRGPYVEISNCLFENNRGVSGGCIGIFGSENDGIVTMIFSDFKVNVGLSNDDFSD